MTRRLPNEDVHTYSIRSHIENLNDYRRRNLRKFADATNYASANWSTLLNTAYGKYGVSIADQLCVQCDIPYFVAQDIAHSINLMKQYKK